MYKYSHLKSKQEHTFDQLPDSLRLADGDENFRSLEPHVLYTKLFIRLEHLQNIFLIERLLHIVQPDLTQDNLIEISLEMISVTVTFWTRNDYLVGMEGDHEWLILGYAVPAAVVLCERLLRAENQGSLKSSIPISAIIQQLSLLGAFLEWLLFRVPCTDRCSKTKDLIFNLLDQILNFSPNTTVGTPMRLNFQQPIVKEICLDYLKEFDTFNWLT